MFRYHLLFFVLPFVTALNTTGIKETDLSGEQETTTFLSNNESPLPTLIDADATTNVPDVVRNDQQQHSTTLSKPAVAFLIANTTLEPNVNSSLRIAESRSYSVDSDESLDDDSFEDFVSFTSSQKPEESWTKPHKVKKKVLIARPKLSTEKFILTTDKWDDLNDTKLIENKDLDTSTESNFIQKATKGKTGESSRGIDSQTRSFRFPNGPTEKYDHQLTTSSLLLSNMQKLINNDLLNVIDTTPKPFKEDTSPQLNTIKFDSDDFGTTGQSDWVPLVSDKGSSEGWSPVASSSRTTTKPFSAMTSADKIKMGGLVSSSMQTIVVIETPTTPSTRASNDEAIDMDLASWALASSFMTRTENATVPPQRSHSPFIQALNDTIQRKIKENIMSLSSTVSMERSTADNFTKDHNQVLKNTIPDAESTPTSIWRSTSSSPPTTNHKANKFEHISDTLHQTNSEEVYTNLASTAAFEIMKLTSLPTITNVTNVTTELIEIAQTTESHAAKKAVSESPHENFIEAVTYGVAEKATETELIESVVTAESFSEPSFRIMSTNPAVLFNSTGASTESTDFDSSIPLTFLMSNKTQSGHTIETTTENLAAPSTSAITLKATTASNNTQSRQTIDSTTENLAALNTSSTTLKATSAATTTSNATEATTTVSKKISEHATIPNTSIRTESPTMPTTTYEPVVTSEELNQNEESTTVPEEVTTIPNGQDVFVPPVTTIIASISTTTQKASHDFSRNSSKENKGAKLLDWHLTSRDPKMTTTEESEVKLTTIFTPTTTTSFRPKTTHQKLTPTTTTDAVVIQTEATTIFGITRLEDDGNEEENQTVVWSNTTFAFEPTEENVPAYLRLTVQTSEIELCHLLPELRAAILKMLSEGTNINVTSESVILLNLTPRLCKTVLKEKRTEDGEVRLRPVNMFLMDSDGGFNKNLSEVFLTLWGHAGLDFPLPILKVDFVTPIVEGEMGGSVSNGVVAAIAISAVAGLCLILLGILFVIMKRRQKKFNYGQRCTPVSLDAYSLDSVSIRNSSRRKNIRASKRSYGNAAFDDPEITSHPLNFAGLANFSGAKEQIHQEFALIPQVSPRVDEYPPGVEAKNRYANVIPLPESRVVLSHRDGDPLSDYINANFVRGYNNSERTYIAAQAPLESTLGDWWRMVWENQIKLILMLTALSENGVDKCADYLPPSEVTDSIRLFGDFQVTLKKRDVKEKYIVSTIQLKNMETSLWREVTHMWYLGWPDSGAPSEPNSLIAFLIEARSQMKTSSGSPAPSLVHCSPGTGRTGTVIACDICIREFEQNRVVDIPRCVYQLRRGRAGAVQTRDQYAFIYQVLNTYATKLTGGALDTI